MIDDDDVRDVAIFGMPDSNAGCLVWAIFLAVLIAVAVIASRNGDDCGKMHCDKGTPRLIKGECLCTEKAK